MSNLITICKNCIFAEKDIEGKQTGCELGRLDKYRERNIGVTLFDKDAEIEIGGFDKNNESFYVVDGFCSTCRLESWPHAKDPYKEMVALDEIKPQYHLIIGCGINPNVEVLERTIKNLRNQKYLPESLVVIGQFENPSAISSVVRRYGGKWKVTNRHEFYTDNIIHEMINEGVTKIPQESYYLYINYDWKLPDTFVANLEIAFSHELYKCVLAEPLDDKYNGLWCYTKLHNIAGGFGKTDLITKVRTRLEEEDKCHLIHKMEFLQTLQDVQ